MCLLVRDAATHNSFSVDLLHVSFADCFSILKPFPYFIMLGPHGRYYCNYERKLRLRKAETLQETWLRTQVSNSRPRAVSKEGSDSLLQSHMCKQQM